MVVERIVARAGSPMGVVIARAREIAGELLSISGSRDPHGRRKLAFVRDEGPRYDPESTDRTIAEAVAFLDP